MTSESPGSARSFSEQGRRQVALIDGGWETVSGKIRREKTVIVYTYIKPERFLAHVATLRELLHRFGRETNQEVVVVELSGAEGSWFFRIKEYDE